MEFIIALFYGNNFGKQVLIYSEVIINNSEDVLLKAEAFQFSALVNNDFDEKIDLLKKAFNLLTENDDTPSLKLKARIADSIGNAITNNIRIMNVEDSNFHLLQKEAINYYSISIEIKEMETISDLTGLTLSYGGLGRCYFAGFPKESENIISAISNFKKDLEISESISQLSGIIMMHSSLGECYYTLEQNKKSYGHYTLSYKYSSELLDKYFALIGLLKVNLRLGNKYDNYLDSILSILKNNVLPNWVIPNFTDEMKNIENQLSSEDKLKISSLRNLGAS